MRRLRSRTLITATTLTLLLGACSSAGSGNDAAGDATGTSSGSPESSAAGSGSAGTASGAASGASSAASSGTATGTPALDVQVVARGLDHGWDIAFLPSGKVLVPQRSAKLALVSGTRPGATISTVEADLSDVYVQGEGGLLGLVLHPDFATSREFTTCQNHQEGGEPVDVRLVTWKLSTDDSRATKVKDLLTGLPTAQSGRHSGCRLLIAPDGALLVGTGDTADGNVAQDKTILGGKTLRLNGKTGQPMPDNPFISAANPQERLVQTFGHRNVQGLAARPGSDQVYSVEHGPGTDDEVNLLTNGANYGWDPAQGGSVGGYDEGVPMTDTQRYPDAVPAVWSSGEPTEATSGADFISGPQWGDWNGALAVAALKGSKIIVLTLDAAGKLTSQSIPSELDDTYGRLRAVRRGPDDALYLTSSNGGDDVLLRVVPRS